MAETAEYEEEEKEIIAEETRNELTIPNQTEYKLESNTRNETKDADKYCTNFADDNYEQTKHLNEDKLIEMIRNKDHCIKELKSKAFQHSFNIQKMKSDLDCKKDELQQLNQKWEQKFREIQIKEKLYDSTIFKYDQLLKSMNDIKMENDRLLAVINTKDDEIKQAGDKVNELQNQIIDQGAIRHYSQLLEKLNTNRPSSAAHNKLPSIHSMSHQNTSQELTIQQRLFKEIQIKLNHSNQHKQLILLFLKQIVDVTNQHNHSGNIDPNESEDEYITGSFWYKEAIAIMENYPELFEKHLFTLKQSVIEHLQNINDEKVCSEQKLTQCNKDKERQQKIIRKLKFEIKQYRNRQKFGAANKSGNGPLLNMTDQQILANMELIEEFCESQIKYFESVVKNDSHSVSSHKRYLLNELKQQCDSIDIKWKNLLSLLSEQSDKNEETDDITSVIKNGLDKLDDIKSQLKIYIKGISILLNDLNDSTVYLNEIMSSINTEQDIENNQCFDVQIFSSNKLSLIIQSINKCNHTHYKLNGAIAKYEKHAFLLQKHLYKINSLLSDSISKNMIKSSIDNRDNNENEIENESKDNNVLYNKIQSMLREKLHTRQTQREQIEPQSLSITKSPSPLLVDDAFNKDDNELFKLEKDSSDAQLQKMTNELESDQQQFVSSPTKTVSKPGSRQSQRSKQSQKSHRSVRSRRSSIASTKQTTIHIAKHEQPIQSQSVESQSIVISGNLKQQITSKKKLQKQVGKNLKKQTVLLQKSNQQIENLEKQQRLLWEKQKLLKKRKNNEIKTINKQISNICHRPIDNQSSIQEMKRLGLKTLKDQSKKQQQISKTMIQQMVQRKHRVKTKYMKQVKELNDNINVNLTLSIAKIKDERNEISDNIRVLVDQFADLDREIKAMVKLRKQSKSTTTNNVNINRNLPQSMMQKDDKNGQDDEIRKIDKVIESNKELRNIIFDNNKLPQISNPVQLLTSNFTMLQ